MPMRMERGDAIGLVEIVKSHKYTSKKKVKQFLKREKKMMKNHKLFKHIKQLTTAGLRETTDPTNNKVHVYTGSPHYWKEKEYDEQGRYITDHTRLSMSKVRISRDEKGNQQFHGERRIYAYLN
jgi:hypothetical protein